MKGFVHITDFYDQNVKNYGPKNQSHHSGSHPQYWFHTSITW